MGEHLAGGPGTATDATVRGAGQTASLLVGVVLELKEGLGNENEGLACPSCSTSCSRPRGLCTRCGSRPLAHSQPALRGFALTGPSESKMPQSYKELL